MKCRTQVIFDFINFLLVENLFGVVPLLFSSVVSKPSDLTNDLQIALLFSGLSVSLLLLSISLVVIYNIVIAYF